MSIFRFRWVFLFLCCAAVFLLARRQSSGEEVYSCLKALHQQGKSGRIVYRSGKGHFLSRKVSPQGEKYTKPVTYALSGGRLGDNLLAYLHARWIAYRDGVPLVRTAFARDGEFALSRESFSIQEAETIPYFPEPSMKNVDQLFLVDWEDPGFRKIIADCLAPTRQHNLLKLPQDRITICLHVRRGGTFDSTSLHRELPLKFPPDSFYIEQLKTIARLYKGKPLYVFLMTDDLDPHSILERYRKAVPDRNIVWDTRDAPPENDLDDFYSIPLFDCLILPDSNFSIVASKLKDYAVRINPTHYEKKKNCIRITGVEAVYNPLSRESSRGREIELFCYWQPHEKGQSFFEGGWITGKIRQKLLEKNWDIRSWDLGCYRPWLLSWKKMKSWQEFKWWLGWDLPAKTPFKDETKFWVFWSLGPHVKHFDFSRVPKEKLVLFLWEPPTVEPEGYDPKISRHFGKIFTWDDDLVDNKKFFKFYYPVMRPRIEKIPPFEEKKFCSLFATRLCSKHSKELYSAREKIIRFFEDKPEEFDLYGRDWGKRKFKNWRGRVEDKIGTLKEYKFCICYENMCNVKGYITEKIFDAFIAGCVPIYWGASNVTDWIPEGCFIDRRKFSSDQELYDFMKNVTKEQYESYLEYAENFLKSDAAKLYTEEQFVKDFLKITEGI